MAQQTLNNGEQGSSIRGKINDNFTELYARIDNIEESGLVFSDIENRNSGDPSSGTPSSITNREITHVFTGYSEEPIIFIIPKCDWNLYLKSVSLDAGTLTVKVGFGPSGTDNSIGYTLLLI